MEYERFEIRKKFVLLMDNEIFTRNDVSITAKGVLATLFALDVENLKWDGIIKDSDGIIELLEKFCCESKELIITALCELKSLGYIEWNMSDNSYCTIYDTSEIYKITGKCITD